jgi:uncharacterized membrane protein
MSRAMTALAASFMSPPALLGTMTSPFDPRTVFFARHAQHVVLIHFPIALFLTGVAFDLASRLLKQHTLRAVASWNLVAAALSTFPVIVTGLLAWQWALEGQRLKGILLLHLVFGLISSALLCIVGYIHLRALRNPAVALPRLRILLELLAVAVIGLTGHLGGFLSGVNA